MSQEARRALDAILYGGQGDLLEGMIDGSVYVEDVVVGEVVQFVFAIVQLGLCEDRFNGIPVRGVAFVEDELDI